MIKSRTIDLLKSLNNKEIKELGYFVESPFFNKNKDLLNFYKIIKKHHPQFSSRNFTKENISKLLYPGRRFRDDRIRNLLSDLLALTERFLVHSSVKRNNNNLGDVLLLEELNSKNQKSLFEANYRNLEQRFSELSIDENYFNKKKEMYSQYVTYNIQNNNQSGICSTVLSRSEAEVIYSIIMLYKNIHDLVCNEDVYNAKFKFNISYEFFNSLNLDEFFKKLRIFNFKYYEVLLIYYCITLAFMNRDSLSNIKEARKLIEKNIDLFSEEEKYNLLAGFLNCCTSLINKGNSSFIAETFDIYNMMLDKDLYVYPGESYFRLAKFSDFVKTGLALRKFSWTREFIKNHYLELHPDQRENMLNYTNAFLNFEKGDYERSLQFIYKVKYEYFLFRTDVKNLMLKIFFEMNYLEEFLSLSGAYKQFLNKNKNVAKFNRISNLNFIMILNELMKVKNEMQSKPLEKLEEDLLSEMHITNKQWLIEKISRLKEITDKR